MNVSRLYPKTVNPIRLLTLLVLVLSACTPAATQTPSPVPSAAPSAAPTQASPSLPAATWTEFGRVISFQYDPSLAARVEPDTVAEVAVSGEVMFAESRPTTARFRFMEYMAGRVYDLPLLPSENRFAQVMVFRTADFPAFGTGNEFDFPSQLAALQGILQDGLQPGFCDQPLQSDTAARALPFLPWLNAAQTLCAQPQELEFASGRGIRYITYYSQGIDPVLERWIFYTFQGLTADGQFYVSALLPVESGIFYQEPPEDFTFPDYLPNLTRQIGELNALPSGQFSPSLDVLDEMIRSIRIEGQ